LVAHGQNRHAILGQPIARHITVITVVDQSFAESKIVHPFGGAANLRMPFQYLYGIEDGDCRTLRRGWILGAQEVAQALPIAQGGWRKLDVHQV